MPSVYEEDSELVDVALWEHEGGAPLDDTEPEPEPELEVEAVAETVKVKYMRPGSVVLDDGRVFTYNRWVEVTSDDAAMLLSLRGSGQQSFVQASY